MAANVKYYKPSVPKGLTKKVPLSKLSSMVRRIFEECDDINHRLYRALLWEQAPGEAVEEICSGFDERMCKDGYTYYLEFHSTPVDNCLPLYPVLRADREYTDNLSDKPPEQNNKTGEFDLGLPEIPNHKPTLNREQLESQLENLSLEDNDEDAHSLTLEEGEVKVLVRGDFFEENLDFTCDTRIPIKFKMQHVHNNKVQVHRDPNCQVVGSAYVFDRVSGIPVLLNLSKKIKFKAGETYRLFYEQASRFDTIPKEKQVFNYRLLTTPAFDSSPPLDPSPTQNPTEFFNLGLAEGKEEVQLKVYGNFFDTWRTHVAAGGFIRQNLQQVHNRGIEEFRTPNCFVVGTVFFIGKFNNRQSLSLTGKNPQFKAGTRYEFHFEERDTRFDIPGGIALNFRWTDSKPTFYHENPARATAKRESPAPPSNSKPKHYNGPSLNSQSANDQPSSQAPSSSQSSRPVLLPTSKSPTFSSSQQEYDNYEDDDCYDENYYNEDNYKETDDDQGNRFFRSFKTHITIITAYEDTKTYQVKVRTPFTVKGLACQCAKIRRLWNVGKYFDTLVYNGNGERVNQNAKLQPGGEYSIVYAVANKLDGPFIFPFFAAHLKTQVEQYKNRY